MITQFLRRYTKYPNHGVFLREHEKKCLIKHTYTQDNKEECAKKH